MTTRVSGMVSGLDTEALVEAMVSTYTAKKEKYQKAQTKLSYKQEAWKNLNTKIYSLYTNISSLRLSSAYSLKKTTVSDTTKATVTAGSEAITGTQTLQIKQLAKAGYMTGGKLDSSTTAKTKLSELGYTGGDGVVSLTVAGSTQNISVTGDTTVSDFVTSLNNAGVKANYDAANQRIFVAASESGVDNDFSLTAGDSAGLSALSSLGLLVQSSANDAAYEATAAYAKGTMGTDASGNIVNYYELDSDGNIKYDSNGKAIVASGVTYSEDATKAAITEILTNLANAYENNDSMAAEKTELSAKIDYTNAKNALDTFKANASDADAADRLLSLMKMSDQSLYVGADGTTYNAKEERTDDDGNTYIYYYNTKTEDISGLVTTVEDESKPHASVYTQNGQAEIKMASDEIKDLAKTLGLITMTTAEDGTETEDTSAYDTLASQYKTMLAIDDNSAYTDVDKAAYYLDGTDGKYTVETAQARIATIDADTASNKTYISNNSFWDIKDYSSYFTTNDDGTTTLDTSKIAELATTSTNKITFAKDVVDGNTGISYSEGATRIDASDAIIVLNDAEFTSQTNSFSINGLTITATNTTKDDDIITISTDNDVDGLYDKIKSFLTQYNEVINEITKLYNADSASDYEPLTDDEKEEMSDSEIEKWETKIKDAILRKDSTLGTIQQSMVNAMMKTYEVDGKTYSLANFGIQTLGYLNAAENENYAYHIDGDSEDSSTSGKTDKLKSALQSDPDSVISFMKQLTSGLYSALDSKMKSTTMSSTYKVYNDKEMDSQYSEYTTLIKEWEEKIEDYEDRYYQQFSNMESALSKLQSNSSSISSLFGS